MARQQDHAAILSSESSKPTIPKRKTPSAATATTPLPRSFFDRDPLLVAPELLGAVLVHDLPGASVAIRLTEVEAYLGEGEDPASHSYRGLRQRNAVMFGPPGHVYVYFTYGMHWCANVVCRPDGISGAVLLRAGEVVTGHETARLRRPTARKDVELARGPARLAKALALTGTDNGRDLCNGGELRILPGASLEPERLRTGPRVGVTLGAASLWRFWLADEPTVSTYRPSQPRRRRKSGGGQP